MFCKEAMMDRNSVDDSRCKDHPIAATPQSLKTRETILETFHVRGIFSKVPDRQSQFAARNRRETPNKLFDLT